MKRIAGSREVPVIYTAHHASADFGEFVDRSALHVEQRLRFSDYGTDETVPLNGLAAFIAERSRALGDLNRHPNAQIYLERTTLRSRHLMQYGSLARS